MTDFAPAPTQLVAQALLQIDLAGNPFLDASSRGFLAPTRTVIGGLGSFVLEFDRAGTPPDRVSIGLPGDMSLDPRQLRSHVTVRSAAGAPPSTSIRGLSAAFTLTPGKGATALVVTCTNAAGAPTDPVGAGVADGIEILAWRAVADISGAQLQGPLFQPAMPFP